MVFFQPGSESQYLNPDKLTTATSTGFRPSSSTSQSDLEQVLHLVASVSTSLKWSFLEPQPRVAGKTV